MTRKILVTSALPYANGAIHLGHEHAGKMFLGKGPIGTFDMGAHAGQFRLEGKNIRSPCTHPHRGQCRDVGLRGRPDYHHFGALNLPAACSMT